MTSFDHWPGSNSKVCCPFTRNSIGALNARLEKAACIAVGNPELAISHLAEALVVMFRGAP